jgi:hypothetical protein
MSRLDKPMGNFPQQGFELIKLKPCEKQPIVFGKTPKHLVQPISHRATNSLATTLPAQKIEGTGSFIGVKTQSQTSWSRSYRLHAKMARSFPLASGSPHSSRGRSEW